MRAAPATRRCRTKPSGFSVYDCLARADEILSRPPAQAHIERVASRGALVARFVLPLELCHPQNRTRHAQPWRQGRDKAAILQMLLVQCFAQGQRPREVALSGRPQIRAIRFSSVEPDRYADWAKAAVDRLTTKHGGLGYLRDDNNRDCDLRQHWEPAKPREGFAYIEVRTG